MKNTGKAYEELTGQIFTRLLAQDRLVAHVQRDVVIEGRSTKHQIDVMFEFSVGPVQYRTIVQCKDWNSQVKQEQVLTFQSVLTDIPGQPRGIIVSRSGFQEGARNVAEHHGIKLYELRAPRDEDWEGLIREIVVDIHIRAPRFEEFLPVLDEVSIRSELAALGLNEVRFRLQGSPDQMFLNTATGELVNIGQIMNSFVPKDGAGPFLLRHDFTEGVVIPTLNLPLPYLPVLAIKATAYISDFHEELRVSVDHLIAYCFKDVLNGDVHFFRADVGLLHQSDGEHS